MLEPEDLIQDEQEFPEQTEQLLKDYAPSRGRQQALLRIRTRLNERIAQRNAANHVGEEQTQQLRTDTGGQPIVGQIFPPAFAHQSGTQARKRGWTLRVATLVAVLCIILLSGTVYAWRFYGNASKPTVHPGATPTQPVQPGITPTQSVQSGVTPTQQLQPTATPTQTVTSGQIIGISEMTMTNATTGWGMGRLKLPNNQEGRTVVHTSDGGKTWQTSDFPGQPAGVTDHFFLNDDTAWVIKGSLTDPQSTHVLMHTTDGGQHWSLQSLPARITNITFADGQHGWAWSTPAYPQVPETRKLYSTTDGGSSWNEISILSTERSVNDLTVGPLPLPSRIKLSFQTPLRGWAMLGFGKQLAALYITQDGGVSWQRQRLPEPMSGPIPGIHAPAQAGESFTLQTPRFTTPEQGVLSVTSSQGPQSPRKVYVYRTTDSGSSWSQQDFGLQNQSGSSTMEAIDWRNVVFISQNQITLYTLGENQWQPWPTFNVDGYINSDSVWFLDSRHGWVGVTKTANGQSTFTLYETNDGSLSWHEVMRVVTDG